MHESDLVLLGVSETAGEEDIYAEFQPIVVLEPQWHEEGIHALKRGTVQDFRA